MTTNRIKNKNKNRETKIAAISKNTKKQKTNKTNNNIVRKSADDIAKY